MWLAVVLSLVGVLLLVPMIVGIAWMGEAEGELKRRVGMVLGDRSVDRLVPRYAVIWMIWFAVVVCVAWLMRGGV